MSYRRRENPIIKICQQCHSNFETWHAGRIYCGQACNMTAWRQRHKKAIHLSPSPPIDPPVSGNLSFSLPNVATVAAGSLLAAGTNYVFNDQPAQQELLKQMKSLESKIGRSVGQIIERLKMLQDYHKVLEAGNPTLAIQLKLIRQKRLDRGE